MTKSATVLRPARASDADALTHFTIAAGHGVMNIYYEGLVPGRSLFETVRARRMHNPASFAEWPRWVVAEDTDGSALGGINCFPHDLFNQQPADPLIGPERHAALASLTALEAKAAGTFYVNLIGVDPRARGQGIGALLIGEAVRQARAADFKRITLSTFEADRGLMRFYGTLGFAVLDRAPIAPHPALEHGGNWALLYRDLA